MKTSNIFEINDDQIHVVVVNEELFGFIYLTIALNRYHA